MLAAHGISRAVVSTRRRFLVRLYWRSPLTVLVQPPVLLDVVDNGCRFWGKFLPGYAGADNGDGLGRRSSPWKRYCKVLVASSCLESQGESPEPSGSGDGGALASFPPWRHHLLEPRPTMVWWCCTLLVVVPTRWWHVKVHPTVSWFG